MVAVINILKQINNLPPQKKLKSGIAKSMNHQCPFSPLLEHPNANVSTQEESGAIQSD